MPHTEEPPNERENMIDTWTLATDADGDLRYNEQNRLTTTAGQTAVEQDLRVAIATAEGEDPMDDAFGLDIFTATNSVAHLRREIRRTLEHDDYRHDRIDAVTEVDVYRLEERTGYVRATVELDTGQPTVLTFNLPLP